MCTSIWSEESLHREAITWCRATSSYSEVDSKSSSSCLVSSGISLLAMVVNMAEFWIDGVVVDICSTSCWTASPPMRKLLVDICLIPSTQYKCWIVAIINIVFWGYNFYDKRRNYTRSSPKKSPTDNLNKEKIKR